ncbi:unnamed protein product [Arctia plantaginis]|uniref:Uncharacterized protein n=1 Tax=Arctia plantaginis TaxID=874455 RepID=A0A8S0Z305_ARCPL|nr:unnamed protein product [Arctia plantaginis]
MKNILLGISFTIVVVLLLNTASSEAANTKTLTLDRRTSDDINPALSSQDTNENGDMLIRRSREIGSILLAVQNQIKSIILDIIREAYSSAKSFTSRLMNKLLSKLQMFTLSDVLRALMNSFTESTSDLGGDLFVERASEPVEIDSWEARVYRNPYHISSMLNSD